jgi:NAD+ synthase (glutamine-hydrolysing)
MVPGDQMRIYLAQINTVVGAIRTNTNKIIEFAQRAAKENGDLVVFHEMAITGYPPKDLLDKKEFVDDNIAAVGEIARACPDIGIVVGFVDRNPHSEGKRLMNAAALTCKGAIVAKVYKTLLPFYDVFDEGRYFEPGSDLRVIDFKGTGIGITICEDIWNDKDVFNITVYPVNPVSELIKRGAETIITINSSPFTVGKIRLKHDMLGKLATKHGVPIIYLNQVGANDSLIFDGGSVVFGPDGKMRTQARMFEEDLIAYDTNRDKNNIRDVPAGETEMVFKALVLGVRDYFEKCGLEKAVVGVSGGIDSALSTTIAVEALGKENVLGVSMPSKYSSKASIDDARGLCSSLGVQFKVIPIQKIVDTYRDSLSDEFKGTPEDITEENIQARVRANILLALSNKFGYLVLNNGNKSESSVGYCTMYGDMAGGLAVISDVPKMMVYDLAKHVNRSRPVIPENILTKPPSAELKPNQKDQDSLPPYDTLDKIITAYVEESRGIDEIVESGIDRDIVEKTVKMINRSEYKRRQMPPGLKVTTKAYGFGRRMPIAGRIERLKD